MPRGPVVQRRGSDFSTDRLADVATESAARSFVKAEDEELPRWRHNSTDRLTVAAIFGWSANASSLSGGQLLADSTEIPGDFLWKRLNLGDGEVVDLGVKVLDAAGPRVGLERGGEAVGKHRPCRAVLAEP